MHHLSGVLLAGNAGDFWITDHLVLPVEGAHAVDSNDSRAVPDLKLQHFDGCQKLEQAGRSDDSQSPKTAHQYGLPHKRQYMSAIGFLGVSSVKAKYG